MRRSIGLRNCAVAALWIAAMGFVPAHPAKADDAVVLSLVLKDHKFEPAEVHAPANTPIEFHVKNLNDIVSEFESGDLHFEKIVTVGNEIVVHVRPQQPGKYNFYDDFHRATQGYLIVP